MYVRNVGLPTTHEQRRSPTRRRSGQSDGEYGLRERLEHTTAIAVVIVRGVTVRGTEATAVTYLRHIEGIGRTSGVDPYMSIGASGWSS